MRKDHIIKKLIVLLIGLSLLSAGCGNAKAPEEEYAEMPSVILRYAEVNPPDHIITKTGQYFADSVKELSRGRVEIQIYDSGKLGDDSQYYHQMQMGALDMYRGNTIALSDIAQMKAGVLSLPYLFRDNEHFWKVCGSELGKDILDDVEESGSNMVGLCYLDEGGRNIMSVNEPLASLQKIQNRTIRTMVGEVPEETIRLMGASPVAMNYSDLFTALQTKIIDGAENPVSSYYYNQFYKVAPYYVRTDHMHAPSIILVSEITWKHLSEEDKEILKEAAQMAQEYNRSELDKAEKEIYEKLDEEKVIVVQPEDVNGFKESVKEIYNINNGQYKELVDQIQGY